MPVTSNVWNRVMRVRDPQSCEKGTAFAIEVDQVEYLISAQHIFSSNRIAEIEFRYQEEWRGLPVNVVGSGVAGDDVIVFRAADERFRRVPVGELPVHAVASMVITQDAYVLGYPFDWESYAPGLLGEWPIPLAKRAVIAGLPTRSRPRELLLDCQVNPGFSGGPVALKQMRTDHQVGTDQWAFVGVVAAAHCEPMHVESDDEDEIERIVPVPTGLSIATSIQCALNIIEGRRSDQSASTKQ